MTKITTRITENVQQIEFWICAVVVVYRVFLLQHAVEIMLHKSSAGSSQVRFTYVEYDVELMEEYAREREIEVGLQVNGRGWGVNC